MEKKINMEKIEIESLFINIRVKNDLLFVFSDMYDKKLFIKELKDIIKKIFLLNGFRVSETLINKYFSEFSEFIYNNVSENVIKSSNDLKFYIENELTLIIENNEYLFGRFFGNDYKEIKNFLFVEIE